MQAGSVMGSQRFCLRWNNHQTNLLSVFDQLLHDEAFVDVTLAVEGQFLKAHKMVLSACSPYFQELFVGHPDKHPIVILKDVPYSDMKSLLDFMYRGEVSVDQDRLTAFLKVAESLRIKGLTEVNEERCDLPSIANSLLNQSFCPPPPPPPIPSLHRLPMSVSPPAGQLKSTGRPQPPPSQIPASQMLNSALTAPKRKRGRPRKLSGSSPNPPLSHSDVEQEETKHQPPSTTSIENHLGVQFSGSSIQHHHNHQQHPSSQPSPISTDIPVTSFRSCMTSSTPPSATPASCGSTTSGLSTSTNPPPNESSPKMDEDEEEDCDEIKMEDGEDDGGLDDEEPPDLPLQPVKTEEPKPGTSAQDSLASLNSTQSDGERFSSSEDCLQSVSVSICEDVSITPYPPRSDSGSQEELTLSPVDDVTLNPVQFAPHFLSHEALLQVKEESAEETEDDSPGATPPRRRDLLEYLMNEDGTVVCKRCGELLPSRTQWYRHKYKFHIESPPAALFKCYRCNVFFKSRKGYLGHLSTRHSRMEERVVMPCKRGRRSSEDMQGNPEDYEKQREKEEKLVAEIIDRVKRECEAQGSTVTRKGYSRRSTIMNT